MKKLALLSVLAVVCLHAKTQTRARDLRSDGNQVFVDDYINQKVSLGTFVNYSAVSASLADFKNKIVIFSFWFTACPQCVQLLEKEADLQRRFSDCIQIIPVTYEPRKTITDFIASWERKHRTPMQLPMIVEDTMLKRAFPMLYNPHYVWILPSGKMVAQTSESFLSEETICQMVRTLAKDTSAVGDQEMNK